MLKKTGYYFLAFISLFVFSLFLQIKLSQKIHRENNVNRILTEIEDEHNIAKQFNYSNAPFAAGVFETEMKTTDGRAANLKAFFRKHNSVLYDFADVIVSESDKNGFDYRLLPAIAFQESTLCKAIPQNSHNCWGWGIYGDTVIRFDSYDEAIEIVARGIKKHYIDQGLTTASKIMAKYTPSSPNGAWAKSVNHFLKALE